MIAEGWEAGMQWEAQDVRMARMEGRSTLSIAQRAEF